MVLDLNYSIVDLSREAREAGLDLGMKVISINSSINSVKFNKTNLTKAEIDELLKSLNKKIRINIKTNKDEYSFLSTGLPEIEVKELSITRLHFGLDLVGGARALVGAEKKLSDEELDKLIATTKERLDVYGLGNVKISKVTDLAGNRYMLVEVPGATPYDLIDLISKQGKFEAKINKQIVFNSTGIKHVCIDRAECARIVECEPQESGYYCKFEFAITLSKEAAARHAAITSKLQPNESMPDYLNETLDLYLDDELRDSLLISTDLKGKEVTEIAISGPGYGKTKKEAYLNAKNQMKKLQAILITGSLPFKLDVVKTDLVKPITEKQFSQRIWLVALLAIIAVSLVVSLRYRKKQIVLCIILTMLSELILILFFAALVKWSLDLISIAGIIASIGTGVDHQVVIVDEAKTKRRYTLKERIKRALFIILSAWVTTVGAMLPLFWGAAGMFKGFAFTTIVGVTIGVLITRPAFADLIKRVIKE